MLVQFITPLFFIAFYILVIFLVCKIFDIKIITSLVKGAKMEFSKWSGKACFGFVILLVIFGISNNCIIFIEKLFTLFAAGTLETTMPEYILQPKLFIFASIAWLVFNFILLAIFETKNKTS